MPMPNVSAYNRDQAGITRQRGGEREMPLHDVQVVHRWWYQGALATIGKPIATAASQKLGIMKGSVLVKVLPCKACCSVIHVLALSWALFWHRGPSKQDVQRSACNAPGRLFHASTHVLGPALIPIPPCRFAAHGHAAHQQHSSTAATTGAVEK